MIDSFENFILTLYLKVLKILKCYTILPQNINTNLMTSVASFWQVYQVKK